MRICFFFIVLLTLNSCSSSSGKEINNQLFKLSSLKSIFNQIEIDNFEKACDGYYENMNLIKLNCLDSISNNFVNSVNRYKVIKKSKDSFILNYQLLSKNLTLEQTQLHFLEQDITNDLIPLDSIVFFLEKEKQNLNTISDEMNNVVSLYDEIINTHDSLYLVIKELAKNNCY
tara:strand:+ start:154 stop:672 length:519 start_codon:yes stop_codon:yes gene_type:complete